MRNYLAVDSQLATSAVLIKALITALLPIQMAKRLLGTSSDRSAHPFSPPNAGYPEATSSLLISMPPASPLLKHKQATSCLSLPEAFHCIWEESNILSWASGLQASPTS